MNLSPELINLLYLAAAAALGWFFKQYLGMKSTPQPTLPSLPAVADVIKDLNEARTKEHRRLLYEHLKLEFDPA